ncbi:MAG: class I SAM-dependent methyltransferase [Ignavibacteriales bacterium]|nr:MAG: class I SAM-dependent methyltransferase [Ignavibacteriales bacterium]
MSTVNYESEFWNQRFGAEEYTYGTEPNIFFKESIDKLSPGKILLIGEGEGRNAVYAAKLGWEVDAVDFSTSAKFKAMKLAEQNNVKINYMISALDEFIPTKNYYDAVGIIFVHLSPSLRVKVNQQLINCLKPGGKILMEVFSKEQLGKTTGGPQDISMLYSIDDINKSFPDLKTILLKEETVYLSEGKHHSGEGSVVRFIGQKI